MGVEGVDRCCEFDSCDEGEEEGSVGILGVDGVVGENVGGTVCSDGDTFGDEVCNVVIVGLCIVLSGVGLYLRDMIN